TFSVPLSLWSSSPLHPDNHTNPRIGATAVKSATVSQLDPAVASRTLITIDQSSGVPVLYASQGDGSNRHAIWSIGSTLRPAPIPGSQAMVVETPENPQGYQRLEIRSYNGRLLRALTTPGADDSDVSPAVAISDDAVYFVREHWRNEGDGDS